MSERTFTESEIREVLSMMTTPCEDEIAMARQATQGAKNDISTTLPMMMAEVGAEVLAEALLSGRRDAHDLRWRLIKKSAARSVAWAIASDCTPPQR